VVARFPIRQSLSEEHQRRSAGCDAGYSTGHFAVEVQALGVEMNWDIVKGNWKQFKGEVQAQWGKLTDDHLDVISGKRIELAGKIQEAYGITKDEAERQIRDFELRNKDALPKIEQPKS
jgi:uncharacterized protein YjbJ (UPF0337 family)